MGQKEKQVAYETTNSYRTLNTITDKTKNVWIVFHGIGYLSRFFLKYFDQLPAEENYIIAPQAPSKYYLNNQYRHVGASWLTKEDTIIETENILAYIDQIYDVEKLREHSNLIVFGYSQGVSIATRWVARRKIECNHLILYAGGIPKELTPIDFEHLVNTDTRITTLVGNNDEYINEERLEIESKRIELLFQGIAEQIIFDGKHEVKKEIINTLV
ncbi:alpha/beta hydrolase [Maribacter sp. HTCC2170]|uniref:alpha/beta hydrolase n=1 Tax=Maribacter sp. (strain HTCC2170 / KCCM 42371) TaxID=313603 RepID=UPI00006B2214|nr:esterase [Maribacter sp. HTCC2170]EAR00324.1 esterase/lipase, putative [Maribacter sp. HTCC2170]